MHETKATFSRRSAARLALVFLLLPLARKTRAEEKAEIKIDNFTFAPETLTVPAGTTVSWINHDDIPHSIVSAKGFHSKALDTGDSYSFKFEKAGSYDYFCGLHPHMKGKVIVNP